jgi:hypothetical protein
MKIKASVLQFLKTAEMKCDGVYGAITDFTIVQSRPSGRCYPGSPGTVEKGAGLDVSDGPLARLWQ